MAFLDNIIAPAGYAPADPTSTPRFNMGGPTLSNVTIGAPPGGNREPMAGPPPGLLDSMLAEGVPGANDPEPKGFLGRLTATSPNGVTFNDRLMALGQILQGNSEGASDFIERQQAKALQLRQAVMARNMGRIQAQAFAKAFRDDGSFDPQAYALWSGAAFDPKQAAELQAQYGPKYNFFTTRPGAVIAGNERTGEGAQVLAAPISPADFNNPVIQGPDGQPVVNKARVDYEKAISGFKGDQAVRTAEIRAQAAKGKGGQPKTMPKELVQALAAAGFKPKAPAGQ